MFSLDRPNSTEPTFIFLRLYLSDGRLKYPIREKVLPSNWNQSAGRVIKDKDNINFKLNKIDNKLRELFLESKVKGALTIAVVRNTLDKLLDRQGAAQNFFTVIDRIIKERETGHVLTPQGKRFSKHTIKGYRHTKDNLEKFDPKMTFEGITVKTYENLVAYFNKHHDHSLNALGKIIKNWKVFLQEAHKMGVHSNLIYKDFRVPSENTTHIYLTDTELEKIYNHNFPNKTLSLARDWFILDCYTGLRISDIQLLREHNINGDFIQLINEKTAFKVVIPLHRYVRAILKKYNGLPPKLTDQKMNVYIKEVVQLSGISGKILHSITKGGKRVDTYYHKWEMVSNHSARRSFITNLLKNGFTNVEVMRLAGLKKLATVEKYFKESPEEVAERMKGHKFWK